METFSNITQGTKEWDELRSKYIRTASRTPVVLGISPFSDIEKLAKEIKYNIKPYYTEAMQRGNELEDKVRTLANKHFDDVFVDEIGINKNFLASLDGINFSGDTIIEIKVSERTYNDIINGIIPDYYMAQIQHQLLVFEETKRAFLIAFNPKTQELAVSKEILRDDEFEEKITIAWNEFENYLKDYRQIEIESIEDEEAIRLANQLFILNNKKKELDLEEKEVKDRLSFFAIGQKTAIGNLIISKQKGSKKIDYAKLINEKNVDISDIEKYTSLSKDSLVFRFTKDEDNK